MRAGSVAGPQLGGPGERLCPSCARFSPETDAVCRHCGYNFDTGAGPSWRGAPILADQPQKAAAPEAGAPIRRSWAPRLITTVVVIVIVAAFVGPLLSVFESAKQLIEDVPGQIDVDVPEITVPDINTGPFGGNAGSYGKCRGQILNYMHKLLAHDGTGSRPLNELFIEASVKMGAGSFEYRTMVSVFADNQGTAILKGTRAGLRSATRDTKRACAKHYKT